VGIGISQVVPVVVTALARGIGIVSIEQPELHLHPKLQAELGDLFIEGACLGSGHITLLETHSELIPLRLMRRIRESSEGRLKTDQRNITSDDVAIYYIETYRGATVVKHLELSENGQLLDPWPNGFFEEGFHERFSE
jgi:predicted ATPase